MHLDKVGRHFNLRPNFELWKWRRLRYNTKGRWQPGH